MLTGPGAARLERGPMPLAGSLDIYIDDPVAPGHMHEEQG